MIGLVLNQFPVLAQSGPTELILPSVESVDHGSGMFIWIAWCVVALLCVGIVLWMQQAKQRRMDPRDLAFRSLSKKLGLSGSQIDSIRSMAASTGNHPVGFLMSPGAVRSASESGRV